MVSRSSMAFGLASVTLPTQAQLVIVGGGPRAVGVRTIQGDVHCEALVNCAGQWARQFGALAGVTVPLYPAEHFYIVTDQIEGVHPMRPVMRNPDGFICYKEEVGGLPMGGFEPQAKPWTLDPIPSTFPFQLLDEDWDQFEILMIGRPGWLDWVTEEQRATREAVAVYDQTSFGKLLLQGRDALAVLQRLCANDVDMPVGRMVCTGLLNARGGFESDLTVMRLPGHLRGLAAAAPRAGTPVTVDLWGEAVGARGWDRWSPQSR